MKSWELTNVYVGPLKTVLEAVERTQIYSVTESIVHIEAALIEFLEKLKVIKEEKGKPSENPEEVDR